MSKNTVARQGQQTPNKSQKAGSIHDILRNRLPFVERPGAKSTTQKRLSGSSTDSQQSKSSSLQKVAQAAKDKHAVQKTTKRKPQLTHSTEIQNNTQIAKTDDKKWSKLSKAIKSKWRLMKFKMDDRWENMKLKLHSSKKDPAVMKRMSELEQEKQKQVELAKKEFTRDPRMPARKRPSVADRIKVFKRGVMKSNSNG